MNQVLTSCPVCANELVVTQLKCASCQTVIEGQFAQGRLGRLNRDQLRFVELLVKNRGNINQVAGDMNVSYTTARTRMDEIVAALGYTPPNDDSAAAERRDVLRRLEAGEMSAEEALRLLRR